MVNEMDIRRFIDRWSGGNEGGSGIIREGSLWEGFEVG